jgi:hypothetical protein
MDCSRIPPQTGRYLYFGVIKNRTPYQADCAKTAWLPSIYGQRRGLLVAGKDVTGQILQDEEVFAFLG